MYPKRDFKYLIEQPDVSNNELITSMRREPFPEILWDWEQRGKPVELLHIYQKGIQEAIAKDRYPLYQLEDIKSYPEFIPSAIIGLKRLWLTLRFSLGSANEASSIFVDSIRGKNINISDESKLSILQTIPYNISCNVVIDNKLCNLGVFASRKAEMIQELVHCLECFEKMIN